MAANSLPRRVLKRVLAPLLNERAYQLISAASKAWDIRTGGWSEPELELIPYAVRRGETALDVGANFGLYCYHLSRAVGEQGRVYAFEPLPFTLGVLRIVARLLRFGNVEIVDKGCGERAERMIFSVPVQESGAAITGLVHMGQRDDGRPGHEQHCRFENTREVECEVIALDDFLPSLREVSFLKCDIEGADLFALRGARRTLAAHHPTVVVEINPWFMEGFGLRKEQMVDFMAELGYAVYRYRDHRLHLTPASEIVEDNWVFVHPDRRDRLAPLLAPAG